MRYLPAMIERLAVPQWNAPGRTLDDWVAEFHRQGHPARIVPEPPEAAWLEIAPLRLRGYVVLEGRNVSAINFELSSADSAEAHRAIEAAAERLGFELHSDEDEDELNDDDE